VPSLDAEALRATPLTVMSPLHAAALPVHYLLVSNKPSEPEQLLVVPDTRPPAREAASFGFVFATVHERPFPAEQGIRSFKSIVRYSLPWGQAGSQLHVQLRAKAEADGSKQMAAITSAACKVAVNPPRMAILLSWCCCCYWRKPETNRAGKSSVRGCSDGASK
jgi:hypothetical protein